MTEPELFYDYVRGKGWVMRDNTITMFCGTVVRWEQRNPGYGERSISFYDHRTVEECVQLIKDRSYFRLQTGERESGNGYQLFTVVKV